MATKLLSKNTVLFLVLFSVLAYLGNYIGFPLFFGVDLIFGSVFVILSIMYLGVIPAIIVAFIAGLYTVELWGHPYAMISFVFEVIFVGYFYQRKYNNLVIIDFIYWTLIGIPLALFFYTQQLSFSFETASFIALKQTVNGVFNTLIAGVIFITLQTKFDSFAETKKKLDIQQLFFYIFMVAITFASATPIVYEALNLKIKKEQALYGNMHEKTLNQFNFLQNNSINPKIFSYENINYMVLNKESNEVYQSTEYQTDVSVISAEKTSIKGLNIWLQNTNLAKMKIWENGIYLASFESNDQKYTITFQYPASILVQELKQGRIKPFIALYLTMLIGVLFSYFLSRWLSNPIRNIVSKTKSIPTKIIANENIEFNTSKLQEYEDLEAALKVMSNQLQKDMLQLNEFNSILEQKVSEQTSVLHMQKERFEALMKNASDGVFILNLDGKVVECSNEAANILGYSIDELKKLHVYDWDISHTKAQALQHIKSTPYERISFDTRHKRKDGSIYDASIVAVKISLDDEEYIYASVRDITYIKENERRLKESEIKLSREILVNKLAADSANIGIWLWDLKSNKLEWNSNMYTIYGIEKKSEFSPYELWSKAVLKEDLMSSEAKIQNALKNFENFNDEFRILRPDGQMCVIKASGFFEIDEEGNAINLIGTNLDITEEKHYIEKLKEAKEQAEQASISKSRFLANMSHEIRTPMTGLLGFIDRLQKSEIEPEKVKQFQTIKNSGETLLNIINDILDFSKIESGKLEMEYSPIILHEEVEKTPEMFKNLASSKNINLLLTKSNNLPRCILGDVTRLKQVVFNLINNAIKFTNAGGNITLQVRYLEDTKKLYVAVIDTGIGIAKENLEKIFDAFSQEDVSTTRKFGGTGLGLTISSRFVQLMGGELQVESEVGKGSKFFFEIPVEVCEMKLVSNSEGEPSNKPLTNAHILVVEDNKTNQMLLSMILDDHGLTYEIANDGAEAVLKHKLNKYDIIFMDENMPIMNGIEATRLIREEQEESKEFTPIIALTANALVQDRERFIDAGMDDYISKPYTEEDIVRVLKRYLS